MNPLSVEHSIACVAAGPRTRLNHDAGKTEYRILKYEHVKKYTLKGVKN